MQELMTIQNVRAYLGDDGTAYLNLEDVARGLGFTQIAASGNEVVRWERINRYLDELNFIPTSGDGFIPENIFYRLAMKAKNETAERFQAIVADEILPSIRKHGTYMTAETIERTLTDPDYIIRLATTLKEEKEKRIAAEIKAKEMLPKAEFYDTVTGSKDCIDMAQAAKVLNFGKGRSTLFKILRQQKVLQGDNTPYQEYIDRGYFRCVESSYTRPDGTKHVYIKTVVFQKGLDFIRKQLIKDIA